MKESIKVLGYEFKLNWSFADGKGGVYHLTEAGREKLCGRSCGANIVLWRFPFQHMMWTLDYSINGTHYGMFDASSRIELEEELDKMIDNIPQYVLEGLNR